MTSVKSFYDSEIAQIEHDIISENHPLDSLSEQNMWYLAGVHDMAERVIKEIRRKLGEEC